MITTLNDYEPISDNQHTEYIDKYSALIFEYHDLLVQITMLYQKSHVKIVPPFATNFRDALFHYAKLYEADTYQEVIEQAEAIEEHLNRAIKDSIMQLAQVALYSLSGIYSTISDYDERGKIQTYIHRLKGFALQLRINAMNIVRLSNDINSPVYGILDCITEIANNQNIKDLYKQNCSEYIKETIVSSQ